MGCGLKVFDLQFSDGKRCRCISMEPDPDEQVERSNVESIFHPGYVTEMRRIVAPPPERLPWKREADDRWSLYSFELQRKGIGSEKEFVLTWPGGILASKDSAVISSAVREHWAEGV